MVVAPDEVLEDTAPLLRPLEVSGSFAGEHENTADVGKRLEAGGLAARRGCHRLVQMAEADVDLSE